LEEGGGGAAAITFFHAFTVGRREARKEKGEKSAFFSSTNFFISSPFRPPVLESWREEGREERQRSPAFPSYCLFVVSEGGVDDKKGEEGE